MHRFLKRGMPIQTSWMQRRFAGAAAPADPYEALGVSRSATEQEIKKAYREKVKKAHPDRGGNHEEFTKISSAYETLSNPEKRRMFDQYGADAEKMSGFGGHRDPNDIFAEMMRGFGMGNMGGNMGRQRQRVADVDVQVSLTLEEIYAGSAKSIRVSRPATCTTCAGEGSKTKGGKKKCMQCGGSGRQVMEHQMGPNMVQQVVQECSRCRGQGVSVDPSDRCTKCNGEGYKVKSEEMSVNIPAGIHHGATLIMEGMSGDIPGAEPGNINVHIEQLPHRTFERRGSDLIMRHKISLAEALLGTSLRIQLLDGRVVKVKSDPGKILKPNGVLSILNEGLPKMRQSGRGHIYIALEVTMPSTLNDEQKKAVIAAFGEPKKDESTDDTAVVTAKVASGSLEEIARAKAHEWQGEDRQQGRRGGGRRSSGGQQQENVQCAQQ